MKNAFSVMLACAAAWLQAPAQPAAPPYHQIEQNIRELYTNAGLSGDFVFGIVGTKGLLHAFTLQSPLRRSPLTAGTPLYVGSHTKAMTGTLLKMLERKKQLSLDSPVTRYLPELRNVHGGHLNTVTLKQLLAHTHGIRNDKLTWLTAHLGYTGGSPTLLKTLQEFSVIESPGAFRYSNVGPIVAALAAERVTGTGWKQLMEEEVFRPLAMDRTSSHVSAYDRQELAATTVVRSRSEYGFYKTDETLHAAGGTISTLDDLARWMQFQFQCIDNYLPFVNDDLFGVVAQQNVRYFTYQRYGYSLGWDLSTYYGDTLIGRFGSFAGVSFHFSFMPARRLGIIAFTNEPAALRLPHVAANLAYNILGGSADWQKRFSEESKAVKGEDISPATAERLQPLETLPAFMAGVYANPEGWPHITVSSQGGRPVFRWGQATSADAQLRMTGDTLKAEVRFPTFERSFTVYPQGGGAVLETGSLRYRKMR